MSITYVYPNALVLLVIIAGLVAAFAYAARRGFSLPVRRIEALDRMDDIIGRATEMGGTLLMGTGAAQLNTSSAPEILMAFAAVRYVAERTAKLGTRLLVKCGSPDHIAIIEDTLEQSSKIAGNPDYYRPGEMVRFLGAANAYISATVQLLDPQSGENVKALISFGDSGGYGASGPTIGMVANVNGVMTLSGTANIHQIHNYVACFDYAVIGDEVYALSAYLTHEAAELGNVMGLDFSKVLVIVIMLAGFVYAAATGGKLLLR
jgi:hypothetical protein